MRISKIFTAILVFLSFFSFSQTNFSSFQVTYNIDTLLEVRSTVQDRQGSTYMIGHLDNNGKPNMAIIKTNGLGKILWQYLYTNNDSMTVYSADLTPNGGIIVGGIKDPLNNLNDKRGFLVNISADGNILWSREIRSFLGEESGVYGVRSSLRNGYFITGFMDMDSLGNNILVAKFDTTGSFQWSNTYGDLGNEEGYSIVEENNGNLVIAGITDYDSVTSGSTSNTDLVLLRLNSNGNTILQFDAFGTDFNESVVDLNLGSDGRYTILANGIDSNTLNSMIYSVRFNTNGSQNFCNNYASNNSSIFATDLELASDGRLFISGYQEFGPSTSPISMVTNTSGASPNGFSDLIYSINEPLLNTNARGADNGFLSVFATGNTMNFPPLVTWRMVKGGNEFNTACGFGAESFVHNTCTLGLNAMSGRISSGSGGSFNLTRSVLSVKDSTTCCRLVAPVANDTIRMCVGSQTNIGRSAISGYNYTWTGVGNIFSSTNANPSVNPTVSSTYKLVVSADGCRSDSALIRVIVAAPRTDLVFPDSLFCIGDSISYSFSPTIENFSWAFGNNIVLTNPAIFSESATIIFSGQDINNCFYRDTFVVKQKPLPVVNFKSDTLICDNVEIDLIGPQGMANYIWNNVSSSSNILRTGIERTHTLTVIDSFGCRASSSSRILHQPSSQFSLGPDTSFCEGSRYTLVGPLALFNLKWNGTTSQSPFLTVINAGTYVLEAQNSFGCITTDTVEISKLPAPVFSLGNDTSFCSGLNIVLSGPTAESYEWSNSDTTQSAAIGQGGNSWLKITDSRGCSYTDTINLDELPLPEFSLGADTVICKGQTITLGVDNIFAGYSWNTSATTPKITITSIGLYALTVTSSNGCSFTDQIQVDTCTSNVPKLEQKYQVQIYPNPVNSKLNIVLNTANYKYALMDISGKLILENTSIVDHTVIPTEGLKSGVYLLQINKEGYSSHYKIIVSR